MAEVRAASRRLLLLDSEIVVVIQARMGSSRLPGKVLADLGGEPMLRFMLARLEQLPWRRIVATSELVSDDQVAEQAAAASVAVVRGSETDVLSRYIAALDSYPAAHLVRLTADCPLVDASIVRGTLETHLSSDAAYTSNVLPRTFPKGLDVEIVSADALRTAQKDARDAPEREHVTPFLYRHPERFKLANHWCERDLGDERWTVDTADDLEFVRQVVASLGSKRHTASWQEISERAPERREQYGPLRLRPARPADSDRLFAWRNDEVSVRFSATGRGVRRGEHERWLTARLQDPATRIWIAERDGTTVGMARLDVANATGEVSIAVDAQARGSGVGGALLGTLRAMLRGDLQCTRVVAKVHRENVASMKVFTRDGFHQVGADGAFAVLEWEP